VSPVEKWRTQWDRTQWIENPQAIKTILRWSAEVPTWGWSEKWTREKRLHPTWHEAAWGLALKGAPPERLQAGRALVATTLRFKPNREPAPFRIEPIRIQQVPIRDAEAYAIPTTGAPRTLMWRGYETLAISHMTCNMGFPEPSAWSTNKAAVEWALQCPEWGARAPLLELHVEVMGPYRGKSRAREHSWATPRVLAEKEGISLRRALIDQLKELDPGTTVHVRLLESSLTVTRPFPHTASLSVTRAQILASATLLARQITGEDEENPETSRPVRPRPLPVYNFDKE
jgi:hypothetical protein